MARNDDWTSVVGGEHATVDRGEGLQIVAAWLAERGISMDDFDLKDVRVDQWQLRGGADHHRYKFWVRTSSLPQSAEDWIPPLWFGTNGR